jgi:DNA-binding CsgD family transcriptional regulator
MARPLADGFSGPPFIGRARELTEIVAARRQARSTRSQVVVELVGEPGIGKTRTLREAVAAAVRDGWAGRYARADEPERGLPYALLRGAFEPAAIAPSPEDTTTAGEPAGAGAAVLAWVEEGAGLSTAAVAGPLTGPRAAGNRRLDLDRQRRYRTGAALLTRAADEGLVLALDDLHWADPETVDFLSYLTRHPVAAPLVLVLAYRPRQLSPRALGTDAGGGSGRIVRIDLGPLAPAEAARLIGRSLRSPEFKQRYEASDGNPLYLQALHAAAAATDPVPVAAEPLLAAELPCGPPTGPVVVALAGECHRLSEVDASVAAAAAVLDEPFGLDLVTAVAGMPSGVVHDAVRRLVERDLLRPVPSTAWFRFRHPVVRQLVYETADPVWRIDAHRRAAVELARRQQPAPVLARHLEASSPVLAESEVRVLLSAARATVNTNPAQAARWLRMVVTALSGVDHREADRSAAQLLQARALVLAGQLREARDLLHANCDAPGGERSPDPATLACWAQVERLLGNYAEAEAILLAGMSTVDEMAEPMDAIRLAAQYSIAATLRGSAGAALPAARAAVEIARRYGQRGALAGALATLAFVSAYQAPTGTSTSTVDSAAGLIDALPDRTMVEDVEPLTALGWAEVLLGRNADARRHLERALRLSQPAAHRHAQPTILLGLAQGSLYTGNLARAIEEAQEARRAALTIGAADLAGMAGAIEAAALSWLGSQADAAAALRLAEESAAHIAYPDGWMGRAAKAILASVVMRSGNAERARLLLESAGGDAELSRLPAIRRPRWYLLLTEASLRTGDQEAASAWAARAEQSAAALRMPAARGFARSARALVWLAGDEPEVALTALLEAAGDFRIGGFQLAQAAALGRATRAALAAGHDEEAARIAEQARELVERCQAGTALTLEPTGTTQVTGSILGAAAGAQVVVAEPARVIRGTAVVTPAQPERPAGCPDNPLNVLTAREREIATLVSQGHASKAIARWLRISPYTVDTHLAKIYRKLGVSSRVRLAMLVAQTQDQQ